MWEMRVSFDDTDAALVIRFIQELIPEPKKKKGRAPKPPKIANERRADVLWIEGRGTGLEGQKLRHHKIKRSVDIIIATSSK